MWLFTLVACEPVGIKLGEDDTGTASIADACAEGTPQTLTLDVSFPEREPGCSWGEDGNLSPEDAVVTARAEDVSSLTMPDEVALCGLGFDFVVDPDLEQTIRYDDNFFLTFDDVVLAASYAPMVTLFDTDGDLSFYDWDQLAGYPFDFEDHGTYCLGEEEGLSTCTVPPPETAGTIALDFGDEIVAQLAEAAFDAQRYDFAFITVGDNDAQNDCSHGAFSFSVDVSYVPY